MKLIIKPEGSEEELLLYLAYTNHGGISLLAKELQGDMNVYHIGHLDPTKGLTLYSCLPNKLGLPLDGEGRLKII